MKKILDHLLQAHGLFAIIALFFGLMFVFVTPPLWGPDEASHFFRAYQISQGKLTQKYVNVNGDKSAGGYVPKSFAKLDKLKERDIKDNVPTYTQQVDNRIAYKRLAQLSTKKDQLAANPYGKIIYPPITYSAPSLGIAIGGLFSSTALSLLFSARIASLLLYILLASFALYTLRKTAVKWIVFIAALLPMSIFEATVVSADSPVFALSLVFFSLTYIMLKKQEQVSKLTIGLITITAALFTMIKPTYVLLVLSLFFLPIKSHVSSRRKRFIRFAIPLICIIIAIVCLVSVKGTVTGPTPIPNTNLHEQLRWLIHNPLRDVYNLTYSININDWVPQTIGLFGASFVFIPGPIIELLIATLAVTTFVETNKAATLKKENERRAGNIYLATGLITALAVITTLYLTWTPVGSNLVQGVQGRYFLPVLVFVVVGIRLLTRPRLLITEKFARTFYPLLMTFSLCVSILWFYRILY